MMYLLLKCYNDSIFSKKEDIEARSTSYPVFSFIIWIFISCIAIRGGFQSTSIDIIDATEMTSAQNVPALINTPFSVFNTIHSGLLKDFQYLPENPCNPYYNFYHTPDQIDVKPKTNIIIIIVESLSNNYIGYFSGHSYTPFIDSLFSKSLVFTNGFANGKESIQGIPAVLSSIPSWQDAPFIFSAYSENNINSFANLLKKVGYSSSFFHGGNNGTMGFDTYCKNAGFDAYYGKNEYENNLDYDGKWGIWDAPFLQFMVNKLNDMPQPFISSVFTINTHHPYQIPEHLKSRFKQEGHPIISCLKYLDYALAEFFKKAKKSPWFNNTLFIITADHAGPHVQNIKNLPLDDFKIPIVFYKNDSDLIGKKEIIANQIDIMPSALKLIHYPKPFFSFGKNLFDKECYNFSVNYRSGIYQLIDSTYCYQFNGTKCTGFYNWENDPELFFNLKTQNTGNPALKRDSILKNMIQSFNKAMIYNNMQDSLDGN
ncbi:MAG: LTA synthase family protein [Saprospiraceae bacterium]|nr:LTA synthase family protein [Saprospiraceae bacterium]